MPTTSRNTAHDSSSSSPLSRVSRTQIVWACLLVAMTGMAGMLSLATGVQSPVLNAPAAAATETGPSDWLAPVLAPARDISGPQWDGIVVHHSASIQGNLASLTRQHELQGLSGLGYHFVIGNGNGAQDGELLVGYRWSQQLAGAHVAGPLSEQYNSTKIGICLIGDGDSRGFNPNQISTLMQVIRGLQEEFGIPDDAVELHRDVFSTSSPGRFFPQAAFQRGLLHASR